MGEHSPGPRWSIAHYRTVLALIYREAHESLTVCLWIWTCKG